MRTRSQASASKTVVRKRKKGDDCAAHEDGAGSKRRRVQNPPEVITHKRARRSSAGTETAEGLCSPSIKKSIVRKTKKGVQSPEQDDGASNKERMVQTHEDPDQERTCHCSAGTEMEDMPHSASLSCREDADEITSGSLMGGRISPTNKPPFQGHILALPAMAVKSSSAALKTGIKKASIHTRSEQGATATQGNSIGQCTFVLEEDCNQVVETALVPPEKGNQNEATPVLTHYMAENNMRNSRHFKGKGTMSGIDSSHMDISHAGLHTDPMKRKPIRSRAHSAQGEKQVKDNRRANTVPMLVKSKISKLNQTKAAKLRWKHLIQSMINAESTSGRTFVVHRQSGGQHIHDSPFAKEQTCGEDYESQSLHRKRKRSIGSNPSSAARQRSTVCRKQQKFDKQLRGLLRWIKTWLFQANFSQDTMTNGQNSDGIGETFIMTEDERNTFAQTMVKGCRQNENLRNLFVESVRILTKNGLMHAVASTVLQEETCEQAQAVMDAWVEFKEQDTVTGSLPLNLLKAVNQLHETRGDLSTKLNTSEGSFGLKQHDEMTWKLTLPTLPEPKPIETKDLGQSDIPV